MAPTPRIRLAILALALLTGQSSPADRTLVDGAPDATMHTSCSQSVGPGLPSGPFFVIEGSSEGGGLLCPLG